jgi:beta-glucanase (GH16 family)
LGESSLSSLLRRLLPLFVLALLPACAAGAQQCPSVVWADEFSGTTLDQTRWSYQIGDGCAEGICGWGNNELQSYQQGNVTVEGGVLKITAKEERIRGKSYTSGRIRTLNKGDWTYGRFEARIKIVQGQGMWPAFWMLPTDEVYGGWPQSGELDIMENVGFEPSTVHGTIHYGDPYPNNQFSGESYSLQQGIFADDFHIFAVEKEPGVIRWMVDDVLFGQRTTADLAPYNWPFDERFHFILNVAVGGNWPGNPDATTVFPQIMEVDYVRVYDGYQPHIAGDRRVANQEPGVVYSVGQAPAGSSISWSVPAGASIVSGQGTDSIVVDWGATGGAVTADISSGCGTSQLSLEVVVEPAYDYDFSFENFDDPAQVTFNIGTSGTLTEISNPDTSGVNSSALAGSYVRDSGSQYDVLVYDVSVIGDASAYSEGQKKFYLDVYTSAPVGTTVLLQLEDSSTATPSNYPAGRHSRYQVQTSVQNQWERLEIPYLDAPDPSTPDGAVDTLIFLFAPNSFTGDTYLFDNFDSYAAEGTGGGDPTALHVGAVSVGTQSAGQGSKRGTATVTVVDDLGMPVEEATVSGTFTGSFTEGASGDTVANGAVTLVTTGTQKGGVSFTFCVDSITHPTLPYDSGANAATCGSL